MHFPQDTNLNPGSSSSIAACCSRALRRIKTLTTGSASQQPERSRSNLDSRPIIGLKPLLPTRKNCGAEDTEVFPKVRLQAQLEHQIIHEEIIAGPDLIEITQQSCKQAYRSILRRSRLGSRMTYLPLIVCAAILLIHLPLGQGVPLETAMNLEFQGPLATGTEVRAKRFSPLLFGIAWILGTNFATGVARAASPLNSDFTRPVYDWTTVQQTAVDRRHCRNTYRPQLLSLIAPSDS